MSTCNLPAHPAVVWPSKFRSASRALVHSQESSRDGLNNRCGVEKGVTEFECASAGGDMGLISEAVALPAPW
eukprot:5861307-Alexandrium_andersonii.AAC.1